MTNAQKAVQLACGDDGAAQTGDNFERILLGVVRTANVHAAQSIFPKIKGSGGHKHLCGHTVFRLSTSAATTLNLVVLKSQTRPKCTRDATVLRSGMHRRDVAPRVRVHNQPKRCHQINPKIIFRVYHKVGK